MTSSPINFRILIRDATIVLLGIAVIGVCFLKFDKYLVRKAEEPTEAMTQSSKVPSGLSPGEVLVFGGIQFVWCPPGEIEQGSKLTPDEIIAVVGANPDNPTQFDGEYPPQRDTLEEGFWLGRYEVTRKQWRDLMHTGPWADATTSSEVSDDSDLPVTNVTWDDIQKFRDEFARKEGIVLLLPTETLWEYACKAGTDSIFSFGDEVERIGEYAWYNGNIDSVSTLIVHPVGQKLPNAWGLYDMHGNANEYTLTRYDENRVRIPQHETVRGDFYVVFRGGNASMTPGYLRSAQRFIASHDTRDNATGFRVLLVPK